MLCVLVVHMHCQLGHETTQIIGQTLDLKPAITHPWIGYSFTEVKGILGLSNLRFRNQ